MFKHSWTPHNRASKACIAHFVAEATERKSWAEGVDDAWMARASDISRQWMAELRRSSIHQIARYALDYARLRGRLGIGENGSKWPWDRPAFDLWRKLNPHLTPADMGRQS